MAMELAPTPPPIKPKYSPEEETEILADGLLALRRVSNCQSLPGSVRAALASAARLLEMYVERPSLRAVR